MGARGVHLYPRHAWHMVRIGYSIQEGVEWRWEHVGSTSIPGMPGTCYGYGTVYRKVLSGGGSTWGPPLSLACLAHGTDMVQYTGRC